VKSRNLINVSIKSLIYVLMIVITLIMIWPLVIMLSKSFTSSYEIYSFSLIPKAPTLKQYAIVLSTTSFPRWFMNTVIYAISVTTMNILTSALAGYALSKRKFVGRDITGLLIISTMMVPAQLTIIPLFIMLKKLHWLNTYQGLIVPWLGSPFGIFLMRQSIQTLPDSLFDAARLDGCSELGLFWHIVLPLSKPALSALGIFYLLWTWNDFFWPLIVANSPKMKTLMVGFAVFQKAHLTDWGQVMAAATLIFIPIFIIYLILQKQFVRGITLSGFK